MNLLPKSHDEFSQKDYWDSFFKKRGNKAFEWYGEYPELSDQLHKYIKPQDEILITGCGNSSLGKDLYDIGIQKITNIDISKVAIRQMQSQTEKSRPSLKYLQMDALATTFPSEHFNVVLDKGTLDALMPNDAAETIAKVVTYFDEILRLLKPTGRYICITLLQAHILTLLLAHFPAHHCLFRAVRCRQAEGGESQLPVFAVVCTKFRALSSPIYELSLDSSAPTRCASPAELSDQIASVQRAAFVCNGLKTTTIADRSEVSFDLFQDGGRALRFIVHVVEGAQRAQNGQYAVFVVPQGRETEWLFATKPGRLHLVEMTNVNRLAIVSMQREQTYASFDCVKDEISEFVCALAPSGLKKQKIPFLSLGDDVGLRVVKFKGESKLSGEFVVEDVTVESDIYRRLFYLQSQLVIQSEAKLKTLKNKKVIVDLLFLTCSHHLYMSIGANAAANGENAKLAVIGLGGGGLCSFLRKFLPKANIIGVDIDSAMLEVAKNWFGLVPDQNLQVVIKDGVEFLTESAKSGDKLQAILFDVDSKDQTIGMSCPPGQFLENEVLAAVESILQPDGYFILNLVLRDYGLRPQIRKSLDNRFKVVVSYQLEEDLNEIVICTNGGSVEGLKTKLEKSTLEINHFFKRNKVNKDVDLVSYLDNLKLD